MCRMNREVLKDLTNLMDQYCTGCFILKYNRSENGKRPALKYCNSLCVVGEWLQERGKLL
ncbi:MAG: hypothetical protein K0S34_628 [Bacillales bacterium]|jgi:hypothetical protein|nr:hypothetical protein [Bacillales bacterium]